MSEPRDPRDDLRRLIDSVEPVTETEARQRAASDPSVGALGPDDGSESHRGALLAAVAAVVALLVGGGVLVWRDADDDTVTTGPATSEAPTVLPPTPTVLAPIGDDPIVSCDPADDEWYRLSAWSGPTGAENADDPPATAFRSYLQLKSALETANSVEPLVPELPTGTWRRVAESPTEVLFGAGDLDLDQIASDDLGPMISVAHVELVDGSWQVSRGGGGSCNELWVYPGDGRSAAGWGVTDDLPLPPETTELHVAIESRLVVCPPEVTAEDVVGPDVIEAADSVTIRTALAVPMPTDEDCLPSMGDRPEPVVVTVRLRQPLGDRAILDGNVYPAAVIDLEPRPQREPPPPAPRIELRGGTNEVQVLGVQATGACEQPCSTPSQPLDLTVAAGGQTASGATGQMGSATLLVPDGLVEVRAEAEGSWCPTVHFKGNRMPGSLLIACVDLDLPHATVAGTLLSTGEGDGWVVTFVGANPMASIALAVDDDGRFEALLPEGRWRVGVMNTDWTQTCTVAPAGSIDIVDARDQSLDLTCD
jgi:hypothetical protein